MPMPCGFDDYVGSVDAFIATRPDLVGVRAYNHQMIDIFDSLRPLAGKSLLDIGASPHGFALERAFHKHVSRYVGIGLGIAEPVEVVQAGGAKRSALGASLAASLRRLAGAGREDAGSASPGSGVSGRLLGMDAASLAFETDAFDLLISLSTFEHFFDGPQVLREMHRVLRRGGSALISFQPVWTCSYGHHLHHVEPVARVIPPWAHLLWTADDMRETFAGQWPADLPMSLDATIDWIYHSREVNRIDVVTIRDMFLASPFEIEWMTPLMDTETDDKPVIANYLSTILPYSRDELMTIGYSLLLNKR